MRPLCHALLNVYSQYVLHNIFDVLRIPLVKLALAVRGISTEKPSQPFYVPPYHIIFLTEDADIWTHNIV